jgi:hypothetical protein
MLFFNQSSLTKGSEAELIFSIGSLDLVGIVNVDPVLPVTFSKQGGQGRGVYPIQTISVITSHKCYCT